MKKILLLLCILSITISAKAQNGEWVQGAYYDIMGVKHSGVIAWETPQRYKFFGKSGDNIRFRANKRTPPIQLEHTQIRGFNLIVDSVQVDSFIVSNNKDFAVSPFLQVMFDGEVKIYGFSYMTNHNGSFMGPGNTSYMPGSQYRDFKYYYGSDPEHVTKLDKKNFIEVMSPLLASKPYVVKRLKDKTFKVNELQGLLYFYRTDNYPDYKLKK